MKIFCYKNIQVIVVMRLTINLNNMRTINHTRLMLVISILLVTLSCNDAAAVIGKGKIVAETRKIDSFNAIELRSHANVEIKKGSSFNVVVSDYENLLPYIEISTSGNTLTISTRKNTNIINSKSKVTITMPDPLYKIDIKGSGNFFIDSPFNDLQTLSIAGSGDINGDVPMKLGDLELKIAGSGNIEMKGTAQLVKATIAGSGNIYLGGLAATEAECLIMGSGDMEINAVKSLKARINGSGDIRYSGNPVSDIKVNGSGRIEKL